MPVNLPFLQSDPLFYEEVDIVAAYIQAGEDVDYYNLKATTIVAGEPVVIYNRIGFPKQPILPGKWGTITFRAWADVLLDPDQATDILMNAVVYYDLDLAAGNIPGYATSVQPTNGYRLGRAVPRHNSRPALNGSGVPIAAKVGDSRIMVLFDEGTPQTYGTVPDFTAVA